MVRVYRYEQSLRELFTDPGPVVFLAGPTVRGNQPHLTSWRPDAVAEFERQNFDGSVVVPEFTSRTESDKGKSWVPAWEFAGLCASDVNLFWVPRTRELIGLTTNHEKGYWLAKSPAKVVDGRPDDAYRTAYLDLMWQFEAEQEGRTPPPIATTLPQLVSMAIEKARSETMAHRVRSKVFVDSPYGGFRM